MVPDTMFWVLLAVKAGLTALVVIAVTVAVERAGALTGAFIATLPVVPGPVFVLLALDHDAAFIAGAATFALAANCMAALFCTVYVVLAQRRSLFVSLAAAIALWIGGAALVTRFSLTPALAALLTFPVAAACYFVVRPYRDAEVPRVPLRALQVVMRGVLAAGATATLLLISERAGSAWTGTLTVFPVMMVSIAAVLHARLGGHAAASVVANGMIGVIGFSLGAMMVAVAAPMVGSYSALGLGLATLLTWNLSLFGLRRRTANGGRPIAAKG